MTKDEIRTWRERYGHPCYDNVTFFPGAGRTTPFGHDNTGGVYRLHPATDRAGGPAVFCPFDARAVFYPTPEVLAAEGLPITFGSLLVLYVERADFEIRIAHFEPKGMDAQFLDAVKRKEVVLQGSLIGRPGSAGKSTGAHTHLEVVSSGWKSDLLDGILEERIGPEEMKRKYTRESAVEWGRSRCMPSDVVAPAFDREKIARGIYWINDHAAYKYDYLHKAPRTYYNSWEVFDGL